MATFPFFSQEEYQERLNKIRNSMTEQNLDGLLVSIPENIYYLTGLNHWGFFAYHLLIVPKDGEMILIARAMEQVIMSAQLVGTRFVGYADGEDRAAFTVDILKQAGLHTGKLGIEKNGIYLPLSVIDDIRANSPDAIFQDASNLILQHRVTLSPNEISYTRQAAMVSDAMMEAAIKAAAEGVREQDIAAAAMQSMAAAGGEYPAYGPFIRSTPTLGHEHGTWTDRKLVKGDVLFIELSGSVARYHAPMGRLVFVGSAPSGSKQIEKVCLDAADAVANYMRPGVLARQVYQTWQDVVDAARLSHYRRHHCGYMVYSAFPPSWSGPGEPIGLRHDSDLELQSSMVFHLMSWLMGSGRGDYFVSNTAIVTENGCEVITKFPQTLHIV